MNMILRDIHFPIQEATVTGYMSDPDWLGKYGKNENHGLAWEVVVQTEEQVINEDTDDETFASPRISWGEFSFPTMRRWTDLEGKTVHSDADTRDAGAPIAYSYFWTHEPVLSSTLKFVERKGNKFVIHWQGTCNPLWSEPYNKNVPFLIQTEAVFNKIGVQASRADTDATVRERLSKYIDPNDFIQHPIKEDIRNIPVENRFGIFDSLLRRIFGFPDTEQWIQRSTIFEPRV